MHIKLKRNILLCLLTFPLLFQCAYFNTFYNAEESFKSALNIIENSQILDDGKLSPEAEQFLDKTIENSQIVINKYPDSKYIDKAYLLIGISSFYKRLYGTSISNLKEVINSGDIDIKNQATLWLAYSFLKQEKNNQAESYLDILLQKDLNKENLYIYYMIKAEMSELNDDLDKAYKDYLLASEITSKSSRKIYIYRKLIKLAEESEDILSKIKFIELLLENIEDSNKIKDLKVEWIEAKKQLGHYEDIIIEIDLILGDPLFSVIEPKLMIYKARSYKQSGKTVLSEEVLDEIVTKFSKKNETSEAYYILASIAMFDDFNLEEAKEYLDKSIEERSRSDYGKKAKELKLKIDTYEELQNDYFYFKENPISDTTLIKTKDMDISIPKDDVALDSLLFSIGQIFYFDFNQIDSALIRYEYMLNKFPDSKYQDQLLNIIEYHNNGSSLQAYAQNDLEVDSLSIMRDKGLSLSLDKSLNYYKDMYSNYSDSISLFNVAYIHDHYFYNLNDAIPIYYDIQKSYPKHPRIEYIRDRLIELNSNIDNLIADNNWKIQFYDVFDLIDSNNIDSAKIILQNMELKRTAPIYSSVTTLIRYIDDYLEMNTDYIDSESNDSVLFNMAKIEYYYFNQPNKASIKLKDIANKGEESDYYNQSIWLLNKNTNDYKIDSTLYNLIDTSSIVFYNPVDMWDIDKIKSDNEKLNILKINFEEEE